MSDITLGLYRHYKGNLYKVIAIAKHSETLEPTVVYQAQYEPFDYWVRPLEMFQESVEVDGEIISRFEKVVE